MEDVQHAIAHEDEASHDIDDDIINEFKSSLPVDFAVRDEATANWVVRKIIEARQHAQRVREWADRETNRAERTEERLWHLFGSQLKTWVTLELGRRKGKAKSLDLPGGRVGYRRDPEKLSIDDEAVVIGWAEQACPDVVVVERKIARLKLKQYVQSTGEVPNGARLEPAAEKFFVR